MSLKSQLELSVKIHRRGAITAGGLAGLASCQAYATAGAWRITCIVLAAWLALAVVRNVRTVHAARAILASPLFYLLAIQHDLSGVSQTTLRRATIAGRTGNGETFDNFSNN